MKKISTLENLKQNSQNTQKEILKVHQESLTNLSANLENLYKKKLNSINSSMNNDTIESIDSNTQYIKNNITAFVSIALIVGITIGILIGLLVGSNALSMYIQNKNWIVPQNMRVKNSNGYFIVNEQDTWNLGKRSLQPKSKIIKLRDL
jgi:ElaB/YqjD/DUF883 family membrane-anchored ribosome-binding protein